MSNQRENYRLHFEEGKQYPIQLFVQGGAPDAHEAKITTLSCGGVGIVVDDPNFQLHAGQNIRVKFSLPVARIPFLIDCLVKHCKMLESGWSYGIEFLREKDSERNEERDQLLWRYLMQEQQKELAKKKPKTPPP